jgi:DNA-binding transcriptional ArsR family regulator
MNIEIEFDTNQLNTLSEFMKAIAGETRQQILTVFACNPQEWTVNQIAEKLNIGQSTASENLSVLKRTGIVSARRSGKIVYYRPNRQRALLLVDQLREYLTTCCPEVP